MFRSIKPLQTIEFLFTPSLFDQETKLIIEEKIDFGYRFNLVEEAYEFKLAIKKFYLTEADKQQACKYLAEKTCILPNNLFSQDKALFHSYVLSFLSEVEDYLNENLPKSFKIEKVGTDDVKLTEDVILCLSKDGFFQNSK